MTRASRLVRRFRTDLSDASRRLLRRDRPGLDGLDLRIADLLGIDDGFFIEAGANDGWRQSNTFYLERRRGWTGLLVEPIPDLAERCRRRRPRSRTINCALVPADYAHPTIPIHYAGLMSLVDGAQRTSDDERAHVRTGLEIQGLAESYDLEVPARTLSSVIDEFHSDQAVDLLSLDVEGFELSVLRGLDLERHRPRLMVIECRYEREIVDYLRTHGYDLAARLSLHDIAFIDTGQS